MFSEAFFMLNSDMKLIFVKKMANLALFRDSIYKGMQNWVVGNAEKFLKIESENSLMY